MLLRQIAEDEPVAPRQRNKSIPIDLETIVLKAMAKEIDRRYATSKELADDLRGFLEHRPILARRPSLREKARKWARRHRSIVASLVGVLLLSVAGLSTAPLLIAGAYERERQKATEADEQRERADELRTRDCHV